MKLPDENGRAAILRYYLKPLKLEPGIDIDALVAELAAATDGASGADLEYLCQTARALREGGCGQRRNDSGTAIAERRARCSVARSM